MNPLLKTSKNIKMLEKQFIQAVANNLKNIRA